MATRNKPLKTDLSFEELIDLSLKTPPLKKRKSFKKRNGEIPNKDGEVQTRDGK